MGTREHGRGSQMGCRGLFEKSTRWENIQMTIGKLYGIGVGPGDPELVTMKAVRLLAQADIVAVPDKGTGEKTALGIVQAYVEGKELLLCPTPMTRDQAVLDECHDRIARQLCSLLDQGKTVCFITLGDPSIYSTYIYVHKRVQAAGYPAELIPGVPSFCAVAARLGISLCEQDQRLLILPAGGEDPIGEQFPANKVYMKAGSGIMELQQRLAAQGKLDRASAVENCTMADERVWSQFGDMQTPSGYFSVVVVKEEQA